MKDNYQDIHYAHHAYKYHEDFQESVSQLCHLDEGGQVCRLAERARRGRSSRLCVARANFVVGDGDDDEIRVDEVDYTPLQLATVLHGRESNVAQGVAFRQADALATGLRLLLLPRSSQGLRARGKRGQAGLPCLRARLPDRLRHLMRVWV